MSRVQNDKLVNNNNQGKQTLSQDTINTLLKEHGCTEIRVISEGEMATTDFIDTRLTVEVNKKNEIERVWVS